MGSGLDIRHGTINQSDGLFNRLSVKLESCHEFKQYKQGLIQKCLMSSPDPNRYGSVPIF
jgi:hypothetical protein